MSDLIDRQAAINAVGYYSLHSGDKLLFADKPLKELPSAQPKRGKWNYNSKIGTFKVWTCDQCGWNSEAEFNFCPHCGADMREVTT